MHRNLNISAPGFGAPELRSGSFASATGQDRGSLNRSSIARDEMDRLIRVKQNESMIITEGIDWSECPGVEIDPNRQSGAPVFAGTRIPVNVVTNNIEDEGTPEEIEEILENFPVSREQVQTVLNFVRRSGQLQVQ